MDMPSWLKIESIIKSFKISNCFNGWFGRVKINYNVVLPINPNEAPQKIESNQIPIQKIEDKEIDNFKLTDDQKILIDKINKVHVICGRPSFDFEKVLKQAINHINNKPTDDWYECAAKDFVQVKEDIDFFGAFQKIELERTMVFEGIKKDINYSYSVIQKIKHCNKRGDIQEEFLTPYDRRFNNNYVLTNDQYERIFNDFQNSLIKLFREFKLRDE